MTDTNSATLASPGDAEDVHWRNLPNRIGRLNTILKRNMAEYARDFDLGLLEARLLLIVRVYQPVTSSQLALETDIDRAQISRTATALEQRGLLVRRTAETDRRESILSLTSEGLALHRTFAGGLQARNTRMFADLSETEIDTLMDALDRVIATAVAIRDGRGD